MTISFDEWKALGLNPVATLYEHYTHGLYTEYNIYPWPRTNTFTLEITSMSGAAHTIGEFSTREQAEAVLTILRMASPPPVKFRKRA